MGRTAIAPLFLSVWLALNSGSTAQTVPAIPNDSLNDTLAVIGRKIVTSRDLIERIELMPWPGKEDRSQRDSILIKALRSLVAEQILAMEAFSQGIGTDSTTRAHVKNLEKLLVRDALYRLEVKPKVIMSQEEINEGLRRYASLVRVLMISTQTREAALKISRALRSGIPVDTLLADPHFAPRLSFDTVNVKFGLLEREQENAVYALTNSVSASGPIEVERLGWVVLYLLEKETNPAYAKATILERTQAVRDKVQHRKELDLADRYSARLLAPHRARATPAAFRLVAGTLRSILMAKGLSPGSEGGYRIGAAVDSAEMLLAPHLNELLVEMEGGGLTIGEILENYRIEDAGFPTLEERDFNRRLNSSFKQAAARELLSREGYRRHLDQTAEVLHDVEIWSDYWRAAGLELKLLNGVSVNRGQKILNSFVAGRARDYHVRLYYNRLTRLALPAVNMVTRRFLGFGGSTLAAPGLTPLWRWVSEAQNVEEISP